MKYIKVKCPYCGHENVVDADPVFAQQRPSIRICDSEDGGCDADFAVYMTVTVTAEAREIVGEGHREALT